MEWIKKNRWSIIATICMIGFAAMVIGGARVISNEQNEIKGKCPRTDLVVLGGRNGTPRYVYDCTGADLKGIKK